MKNITVSVDDEIYRAARIEAAKRSTSVSAVVRSFLQAFAHGEAPFPTRGAKDNERQNRERLVKLLRECKLELGHKPSREKTYEGGRFSRF